MSGEIPGPALREFRHETKPAAQCPRNTTASVPLFHSGNAGSTPAEGSERKMLMCKPAIRGNGSVYMKDCCNCGCPSSDAPHNPDKDGICKNCKKPAR